MVEYIRGSRVDDYAPLFDLNVRLCAMDLRVSTTADGESCFDACSGVSVQKRHLAVLALCIKARVAVVDAGYMVSHRLAKALCQGGLCHCPCQLYGVGADCWVYAGGGSTSASLPRAVLRLTAALVGAHGKDVGASGGMGIIAEVAPSWRPLLQQARVQEVSPDLGHALPCDSAAACPKTSCIASSLTCRKSLLSAFRHT